MRVQPRDVSAKAVLLVVALFAVAMAAFVYLRDPAKWPDINLAGPATDPEHPIRSLTTYDVFLSSDQAVRLGIVIAMPLRDDSKSRTRVDRKFALYRAYFDSVEFRQQYGKATPERAKVYVSLHSRSDRGIRRRIEEHLDKLRAAGIDTRLDLTG
jgi:hypothetical protein